MSAVTDRRAATPARARPKPWRWVTLVVVLLLAVGAGLALRGGKTEATAAEKDSKLPAGPMELAAADVAQIEQRALTRQLPLSGTLRPLVQASVKARVAGDLLAVQVREGQAVQKGEVLARIDLRNLGAQFDAQRATLDKARADLALARVNRDSNARLLEQKFISQNAFDAVQSAFDAAAASVKVAEAQLRLAQVGVDDAVVRAPIDGVVSQRLAQPGEKVAADTPLLAIVDLRRLELEAPVPASDVPAVKIGQPLRFTVDGYRERTFEATVERINPATDAGTRAIRLYLSVDNSDGALKGGMFAQGDLLLDPSAPLATVPAAAVRRDAGVPYLLVIEDGHLRRRAVTLGIEANDGAFVELRDGPPVGTPVLAARIDSLQDGAAVTVPARAAR